MVLNRYGHALEVVGYSQAPFGLVVFTHDPQSLVHDQAYYADELTVPKNTADCVRASLTKHAKL